MIARALAWLDRSGQSAQIPRLTDHVSRRFEALAGELASKFGSGMRIQRNPEPHAQPLPRDLVSETVGHREREPQ